MKQKAKNNNEENNTTLKENPKKMNSAKEPVDTLLERGKEFFAIWASLAGILAATLWIIGRAYARGFFQDGMGIPLNHIKLSIWEYGEFVWMYLLVGSGLFLFMLIILKKLWDWNERKRTKHKHWGVVLIYPAWAFLLFLIVILLQTLATNAGNHSGSKIITEEGSGIDFSSNVNLNLEAASVRTEIIDGEISYTYLYQGFRLLTLNNDYYYLSHNCFPGRVFIIKRSLLINVQLGTNIASNCMAPAVLPPPTPSPIATPTKIP